MHQKLIVILLLILTHKSVFAAEACRAVFSAQTLTEDEIKKTISSADIYLDHRNQKWSEEQKCLCCHTTLPFVFSRAYDSKSAAAFNQFEKLARQKTENPALPAWYGADMKGKDSNPTESVLNAITLIMFDRKQTQPALREVTLKAVSQIFEHIDSTGKIHWLDFELQPFESKKAELWGNSMAVLAVEMARKYSGNTALSHPHYVKLKQMLLQRAESLNLNEKSVLLWAHSLNRDLLSPALFQKFKNELVSSQNQNGSWNQNIFIQQGQAINDSYSTAMALIALSQNNLNRAASKKAAAWLMNQQETSSDLGLRSEFSFWKSKSLNREKNYNHLFASDAATGFSSLALQIYLGQKF